MSEICLVADNVAGRHISCNDGIVFCWGKASAISFYPIDKRRDPNIAVEKITARKDLDEVMEELQLSKDGSIKECKKRLSTFQKGISNYDKKTLKRNVIHLDGAEALTFEGVALVGERLMYATCQSKRGVVQITIRRNAIGLQGH